VWCPKKNENTLAYCDDHGQLGLIDNVCSEDDLYKNEVEVMNIK